MAIDLAVLKTELVTDPLGLGYAPKVSKGSCGELADILNKVRNTITVPLAVISAIDLLEAIRVQDFIAGSNQTPLQAAWFQGLLRAESIRILKDNGNDSQILKNIMTLLVNASASETNVRALASRKGSRAEQLFSMNITPADVSQALELP